MSAVFEEIYSLLVPLAGSRLIVPRAAIIEVMGFNPPKERPDDAPEWVLGWLNWQNNKIPLVSFEGACGQPLPEFKNRTRITVIQAISGLLDPPAFAVATQGYPYLLRVNRGVLKLDESDEVMPEQLLARVRMANERPGIPDLEVLERMIAAALGIKAPEPVFEAIEVTPDEPTALGTASMSFHDESEAIEMSLPEGNLRIDDDMDLEAVLESAIVDSEGTTPAASPDEDPEFGAAIDDLSIDGLEVDET